MKVGLIGLGRMGFNLALNMRDHGHEVVVYNRSPEKIKEAEKEGIKGAYTIEDLVKNLERRRIIWLMELMEKAFEKDPKLSGIKGVMHSSGEGLWTVEEALNLKVPVPVIAQSLFMRYRSEQEDTFAGKVVAALRNEFGGHAVEKN